MDFFQVLIENDQSLKYFLLEKQLWKCIKREQLVRKFYCVYFWITYCIYKKFDPIISYSSKHN